MGTTGFGFGVAIAAWIVPATAFAQPANCEWGWRWGLWGVVMMLVNLVFWVPVLIGVFLGIRWLMEQGKKTKADSAIEILRERYARGEIDKDEFEARKRDLA